jgi:hypothetical protein
MPFSVLPFTVSVRVAGLPRVPKPMTTCVVSASVESVS